MASLRACKVAEQIKKEISSIINHQVKDPRVGFVTITKVEVSNDLRHAKVYISSLEDEAERAQSIKGLEQAKGFIRKEIAKRINLRYTPELIIRFDDSIEHGVKISKLLSQLKNKDSEEEI